MLTIPRAALGISTDADAKLEFKWADNIRSSDIMDFHIDGDAAPRGRLNFYFEFNPKK